MDNSIVLALIKKDLDELYTLVEALEKETHPQQLLIDISIAKAQTLLKEFSLLTGSSPIQEVPSVQELSTPASIVIVKEASEKPEAKTENPEPVKVEEIVFDVEDEQPEVVSLEKTLVNEQAEVPEEVHEKLVEPLLPEPVQEYQTESVAPQSQQTLAPQISPQSQPLPQPEPQLEHQSQAVEENGATAKKVLGERFSREASLNERLGHGATSEPRIKGKPVTSLKKAIGLNDKFMFARELFGNDRSRFELSLDELDRCMNLEEAITYMEKNFQWIKNDASMKFIELVKKRFD